VIVRWGLGSLAPLLEELTIVRPYIVASNRWRDLELGVDATGRWERVPSEKIDEVAARTSGSDGVLGIGGGSAIDLTKAVSAATGLRQISIPTTYSGSEWTPFFGVRDAARRLQGGGGGALLTAIVYEPRLTLDLPRRETVGTALNALAHCAEALYVRTRNAIGDRHALAGAAAIAGVLPDVVSSSADIGRRRLLLEGAMKAGAALASAASGLPTRWPRCSGDASAFRTAR
jgi:maleylacetate reductase